MPSLLLGVPLAALTAFAAPPPVVDLSTDAVVRAFQDALKQQDRERFCALFLKEGIAWQKVHGEAAILAAKAKGQALPRVPEQGGESPFTWFDRLAAKGRPFEERVHDLKVVSDGNLASVTFRFEFVVAGVVRNEGLEAWHLVKTEQGWRIASVVYSVSRP